MADEGKEVALKKQDGSLIPLMPADAEGVYKVSKYLAASDLVPKSFGQKPENVFAAIMYGREIGVSAMQALSNIAVVNGRPSVWGELATALVRQSGTCESLNYKFEGEGIKLKCIAKGKRKGDAEAHEEVFSMEDAKLAGFADKDTYRKHPKDMLMWKALHRLFKFLWPDVLKGLSIQEVADDEPMREIGKVEIVKEESAAAPAKTEEKPEAPASDSDPEQPKKRGPGRPPKAEAQVPAPAAAEVSEGIPAEEEVESPIGVEPLTQTLVRVFGTIVGCTKHTDPDTQKTLGYSAKMETVEGEKKYAFKGYDEAVSAGKHKGKTVELFVDKKAVPFPGVDGTIEKCSPVSK